MAEIKIPRFQYKPPTADDCFRHLSAMSYKSPIETISQGFRVQMDNDIMKAIHSYGINVDRDELIKALQYDRNQYEEGFIAGCKLNTDVIKREVAREICCEIEEEIVAALESNYRFLADYDDGRCDECILELVNRVKGKVDALRGIESIVEELKKKYTEDKNV